MDVTSAIDNDAATALSRGRWRESSVVIGKRRHCRLATTTTATIDDDGNGKGGDGGGDDNEMTITTTATTATKMAKSPNTTTTTTTTTTAKMSSLSMTTMMTKTLWRWQWWDDDGWHEACECCATHPRKQSTHGDSWGRGGDKRRGGLWGIGSQKRVELEVIWWRYLSSTKSLPYLTSANPRAVKGPEPIPHASWVYRCAFSAMISSWLGPNRRGDWLGSRQSFHILGFVVTST